MNPVESLGSRVQSRKKTALNGWHHPVDGPSLSDSGLSTLNCFGSDSAGLVLRTSLGTDLAIGLANDFVSIRAAFCFSQVFEKIRKLQHAAQSSEDFQVSSGIPAKNHEKEIR